MKRQRNRRGFTLAETLAALVIVVLLAMSVQMGTMTALRTRTASRFQSESEILAATLNSALGDMLHYATCARYDGAGGTVYLNNPGYGIVNGQILDRGGRLYVNATANISVDSEDATLLTLTGAGAYTDLTVSALRCFTTKITACSTEAMRSTDRSRRKKPLILPFVP